MKTYLGKPPQKQAQQVLPSVTQLEDH